MDYEIIIKYYVSCACGSRLTITNYGLEKCMLSKSTFPVVNIKHIIYERMFDI